MYKGLQKFTGYFKFLFILSCCSFLLLEIVKDSNDFFLFIIFPPIGNSFHIFLYGSEVRCWEVNWVDTPSNGNGEGDETAFFCVCR